MANENNKRIYQCMDCGILRSKNEGGATFTVCDECWDRHYKQATAAQRKARRATRPGGPLSQELVWK